MALQLVPLCIYCRKYSSQNLSLSAFVKALIPVFQSSWRFMSSPGTARALTMAPRPSWSLLPSPPRLLRFSPSGIFAVLPACQAPGALLPVGSPAYPPACRSLATVSRWFAPSPPSGLLRWHPLVRPFLATLCLAYFLPPFPLSYPTIAFHII